jgi:patatin-like phospholipase/acyl hydrolase
LATQTPRKTFKDRLAPEGPKKLLALDGGGILGVISLEFLAGIEELLRKELDGGDDFVLADYFDYIAGTSTGAIIATCLAMGMPVASVREFYHKHGRKMFDKDWLYNRFLHRYGNENLERMLKESIREQTGEPEATLGSEKLRTLLMVVLRNATTDSPWPLSNNPGAMFNDPALADCNLKLPLWQVVRASTAAPTFFPPEVVRVGDQDFVFVDGGVTVFNNPAFQLFCMATVDAYRLRWQAAEDKMLLVSIGTGLAPNANKNLKPGEMNLLYNATSIPSALMAAASAQQDLLCRVFGRTRHGAAIDLEIGDMLDPGGRGPTGKSKLFTYVRYNVDLTQEGLNRLNLSRIKARDVQAMDSVEHIKDLARIGRAAAVQDVSPAHFQGFSASHTRRPGSRINRGRR